MAELRDDSNYRVRRIRSQRPTPPSFREMAAFAELSRLRARAKRPARVRPVKSLLLSNLLR